MSVESIGITNILSPLEALNMAHKNYFLCERLIVINNGNKDYKRVEEFQALKLDLVLEIKILEEMIEVGNKERENIAKKGRMNLKINLGKPIKLPTGDLLSDEEEDLVGEHCFVSAGGDDTFNLHKISKPADHGIGSKKQEAFADNQKRMKGDL